MPQKAITWVHISCGICRLCLAAYGWPARTYIQASIIKVSSTTREKYRNCLLISSEFLYWIVNNGLTWDEACTTHRHLGFPQNYHASRDHLQHSAYEPSALTIDLTLSTTSAFFFGRDPTRAKLPTVVSIPRSAQVAMLSCSILVSLRN